MTKTNAPFPNQGEPVSEEYGFEGEWIHKPVLAFTYGEEPSNPDGNAREKMKKAPEGNNIITFNLTTVATGLKITASRLRRANRDSKIEITTINLPPLEGQSARMQFTFIYGGWQFKTTKIRYDRA
ncbi:MAG: hypothetical protein GY761_02130 [Hyphomicrobiales bacterium]|nr:hypothetical protein [Hyphomicrobiales bacterium]